ncbi:MAG TPA: hypothetical protein VII83_03390 [Gaiellaceae bacterium]|jgi:hypothetical protein
MTLAVPSRSTTTAAGDGASSPPELSQAAQRKRRERLSEVAVLGLVLLGIAVFFIGYATGRHDDTFGTNWYSPLRGTSVAPHTFGSVQGGSIDPAGNTPLLVTVRGLRILPANEHYVLYVLDANHKPLRCGAFAVGEGTTQIRLNFPGLPKRPHGWKIAREKKSTVSIGETVAQTAWH